MIFDEIKIKEISRKSKAEKWEYPKTFNALKDAGVEYYDVEISQQRIVYFRGLQNFHESISLGFQILQEQREFGANSVKLAIAQHQKEKTSYQDFLHNIALAGVKSYRVDMVQRTVTYYGMNPNENYTEKVPQF